MAHPPMLHRKHSNLWWTKKGNYVFYVLREVSALFVAGAALSTVALVAAVQDGGYPAVLDRLAGPGMVLLSVVALAFALLHSVTFFVAAGKAIVPRVGTVRVAPRVVVGAHVLAFVLGSAVVGWAVLA